MSSESVFDGDKGLYGETDQVNPVLTYGRQKVKMEELLQQEEEDHQSLACVQVVVEMAPGKVRLFSTTDLEISAPGKNLVISASSIDFKKD